MIMACDPQLLNSARVEELVTPDQGDGNGPDGPPDAVTSVTIVIEPPAGHGCVTTRDNPFGVVLSTRLVDCTTVESIV
jgi:hypothetical protein